MEITQFNLDEFLKDGKLESNPAIQPGDCLLFGQPKGFTFASASRLPLLLAKIVCCAQAWGKGLH